VSPLPLLKLAKALARLKSPPRGRNRSPELLRPARDSLTVVLPSLPADSWPLPRHRVRRGTLFPSTQLRRSQSHHSSCLPQLQRPHHHGEERRHPQPSVSPWPDALRPIQIERLGPCCPQPSVSPWCDPLRRIRIERLGPRITLRTRVPWRPGPPVSAQVLWRWARSVSAPSPSTADAPGPLINARPPPRVPSTVDLISAVGFRSDS
jgi:hypothetical protein